MLTRHEAFILTGEHPPISARAVGYSTVDGRNKTFYFFNSEQSARDFVEYAPISRDYELITEIGIKG